jgi:hypothetical protein
VMVLQIDAEQSRLHGLPGCPLAPKTKRSTTPVARTLADNDDAGVRYSDGHRSTTVIVSVPSGDGAAQGSPSEAGLPERSVCPSGSGSDSAAPIVPIHNKAVNHEQEDRADDGG